MAFGGEEGEGGWAFFLWPSSGPLLVSAIANDGLQELCGVYCGCLVDTLLMMITGLSHIQQDGGTEVYKGS